MTTVVATTIGHNTRATPNRHSSSLRDPAPQPPPPGATPVQMSGLLPQRAPSGHDTVTDPSTAHARPVHASADQPSFYSCEPSFPYRQLLHASKNTVDEIEYSCRWL
ncbi:hypothetical protein J5N97_030078 [Dioscorea zingiberensis]|uniref:Uncharacterized protein n=1 Tax=Dioscorea zingiberensis TaxID=325984 RepID=A0A9D5H3Q3_9LILI|nr:hypothetical protein J5N97_030078 [Dioscorea zingiberensis]